MGGFAAIEGIQHDGALGIIAQTKGFQQRIVRGFIFRLNQGLDKSIERHSVFIGPGTGGA